NECAGNVGPGVGEACGGRIVTSNALATAVTVYAEGQEQTCCTECSLQCNAVGSSTVKHCEVAGSSPPSLPPTLAPMQPLFAQLAAAEEKVLASETMTALLGASAMVAVVALIVVKRRADAAAHAREAEDAYYPLLE
ncbi:hypothetical protein PR003_g16332, partial [Phytophthora rubi]